MASQTARVAMTSSSTLLQTRQWLQRTANIARKFGFESGTYGTSEDWPLIWLRRLRHRAQLLYLSAGIHGDEPAGVEALISELESAPAWLENFSLLLCPVLNPAGCASGTRFDSAGLDLNRDYRKCLSPTTRAHKNFLEQQPPPKLCLSFHEDWEANGFYLYEINTSQHPCIGPQILTTIEPNYQLEKNAFIDGHQVISRGYIFHPPEADLPEEWPEAIWLVKRTPCLSLTFETPTYSDFENRVHMHRIAMNSAVENFLRIQAS